MSELDDIRAETDNEPAGHLPPPEDQPCPACGSTLVDGVCKNPECENFVP